MHLSGIPTEKEIAQAVVKFDPQDRVLLHQIVSMLTEHLGSAEAARLWLVTPLPEVEGTPLEAITQGKAKLVLDLLDSRWGAGPAYA